MHLAWDHLEVAHETKLFKYEWNSFDYVTCVNTQL